jgi:outer membrane protein TolC
MLAGSDLHATPPRRYQRGRIAPLNVAVSLTTQPLDRQALGVPEPRLHAMVSPDHDLAPLVERALEHNRDCRIAALQAQQARASDRIDRTQHLPALSASPQLDRQHFKSSDLGARYGQDVSFAAFGVSDYVS